MRQEDQGAQAPCRDRYHRPAGRCRGPSRRHSGSRGAGLVIEAVHSLFPWLRHLFADSAYAGDKLRNRLAEFGDWTIELVKRPATAVGFQLLPRRWVVERTLAWLNRNRRLAKDFEASLASATAWIYIASMQLLVRRLA
jgi:transposase